MRNIANMILDSCSKRSEIFEMVNLLLILFLICFVVAYFDIASAANVF